MTDILLARDNWHSDERYILQRLLFKPDTVICLDTHDCNNNVKKNDDANKDVLHAPYRDIYRGFWERKEFLL